MSISPVVVWRRPLKAFCIRVVSVYLKINIKNQTFSGRKRVNVLRCRADMLVGTSLVGDKQGCSTCGLSRAAAFKLSTKQQAPSPPLKGRNLTYLRASVCSKHLLREHNSGYSSNCEAMFGVQKASLSMFWEYSPSSAHLASDWVRPESSPVDEDEIKNKNGVDTSLASEGIAQFVDLWEAQPCLWDPE